MAQIFKQEVKPQVGHSCRQPDNDVRQRQQCTGLCGVHIDDERVSDACFRCIIIFSCANDAGAPGVNASAEQHNLYNLLHDLWQCVCVYGDISTASAYNALARGACRLFCSIPCGRRRERAYLYAFCISELYEYILL